MYPIVIAALSALACAVLGLIEFAAHPGIPIGPVMAVLLFSFGYMSGWSMKGGGR